MGERGLPGLECFLPAADSAAGACGGEAVLGALGGDYFTRRDPERATRRAINQLNQLDFTVTLNPREDTA
ncbi:hypothetical protein V1460_27655 [Streptomyces sp. SCSIO 30461]|uniref:hypothetical protein n=1 Tax=Streptomyces sp. SCSIO 30461 TaxID=3118085 RepID=UPI0030CF9042